MGWWNDARTELVRRLWIEKGRSAGEIAEVLGGGATRNSVLGKLYRLGLVGGKNPNRPGRAGLKPGRKAGAGTAAAPRRDSTSRVKAKSAPRTRPARPAVRPELEADLAALKGPAWAPLPGRTPVPVEALARHGQCRWPIGEVGLPGFGFCGAPTDDPHPYCRAHALRAYPALGAVKQAAAPRPKFHETAMARVF